MNYQDQSEASSAYNFGRSTCVKAGFNTQLGFSFIELLMVISLLAILAVATTPFLSQFILRLNGSLATEYTVSALRKAQSYAQSGRGDLDWGVCLNGNTLRVYGGSCANPTISEEYQLASTVSVTGLSDISFSRLGVPSSNTTITVSTTLKTNTISLNQAGGLEEL